MTDEQLKSALIEVRDHMLTQFPVAEKDCGFSPKFHRKMRQLIEMEKHPLLYQMRRIVAAILIALGISGGLVLGFSEEARAEIVRWFVERFTNNEYRYQNNMGAIENVSSYTLEGIVLEEYQLVDRHEDEDTVNEAYTSEKGELLIFTAMNSTRKEEFYLLFDENMECQTVFVNGNKADLYLSEKPDESNIIVWQSANGTLLSIQGFLDEDQLIEMAEKIK